MDSEGAAMMVRNIGTPEKRRRWRGKGEKKRRAGRVVVSPDKLPSSMPNHAVATGKTTNTQQPSLGRAGALLDPRAHAAILAHTFQITDVPMIALYDEAERLTNLPDKEKLEYLERMLIGQAISLQAMFTRMAIRAEDANFIDHMDTFGHLALKAQRQCRATVATLAEIKNPSRATFIKNMAENQQINVGAPGSIPISNKNALKSPNELLKGLPHASMDEGGTHSTIPLDTPMETVAVRNRPKLAGGQDKGQSERKKARPLQRRNKEFSKDAPTANEAPSRAVG